MITEAQRQEYIARGYDIIFERNNQVFVVNSQGVSSWDDEKREQFCNTTGLSIFFEEDGNPVFYDPEYFEINDCHLQYIGTAKSDIPQPINCHSMRCMFHKFKLQSLDLTNWDVSAVLNMSEMFNSCTALQSLGISNWDVSNVINMYGMFCECKSLQSLDLSTWDVSNVTDMQYMFMCCSNLRALDLNNWNVSNVENTGSMFHQCTELKTIELGRWDVSNIKYMDGMFHGCNKLQSLDLSTWDVSSVRYMNNMFEGCSVLQSLDIRNWDVSSIRYVYSMFEGCEALQQTYGMSADELQEALKSGNWPSLPTKRFNILQKIKF